MFTRRSFNRTAMSTSLGAAATLVMPRTRAFADAEFRYKFATTVSTDDPISIYAQKAADRIKDETKGRLVIDVFPNGQLGNDSTLLSNVRSGSVEFINGSDNTMSVLTPVSAISNVAFAYKDYETAWKSVDEGLGPIVSRELAKAGITVMDKIWDSGMREVYTSSKQINSAADFAGMKVRVPVTPITYSAFKDMGASPTSVNFNEVYSALQTHLVDGMETALVAFLHAKLYEVQKYCTLTNHAWSGYWIAANSAAINKLPKDLQDIVRRVFNDTADEERQASKKANLDAADELKKLGMTVNAPSDPASFRDRLAKAGYYKNWEQKFGNEAWSVLEKFAGKLG